MQLFLLGVGSTAGKPDQLLCILVTAADYCFVYNSSTARPRARLGPMVLDAAHPGGAHKQGRTWQHGECTRHGKPIAALGFALQPREFTAGPAFLPQHLCKGICM